ncbi:hypothetical protein F3K43_16060 [Streptomyces sp. LBUM 1476]|nr:hypothetical protein [Streptomyces sp. LBUM 1476]
MAQGGGARARRGSRRRRRGWGGGGQGGHGGGLQVGWGPVLPVHRSPEEACGAGRAGAVAGKSPYGSRWLREGRGTGFSRPVRV